jgi:hypothetical protein
VQVLIGMEMWMRYVDLQEEKEPEWIPTRNSLQLQCSERSCAFLSLLDNRASGVMLIVLTTLSLCSSSSYMQNLK